MINENTGKLFYIETEPWLVMDNAKGEAITRKVISMDKNKKTCKVRFQNKIIEMNYFR